MAGVTLVVAAASGGAFVTGFAANRGGTCAVMAMRNLVTRGDPRLAVGFVAASAAGGLVAIPFAWVSGRSGALSGGAPFGLPLVIGALLLGLGATLNNGCLIGSLWRLGNGETRLLALPLGLALGFSLASPFRSMAMEPSLIAMPGPPGFGLLGAEALLLILAVAVLVRVERRLRPGRPRLLLPMLALGISGAILFVVTPGWTYADLVKEEVVRPSMRMLATAGPWLLVGATVAGAIVSALLARTFHWRRPAPVAIARTIAGGTLMAAGAELVPGGNDFLLLAALPAGSLSGLFAYLIMSVTILALELGIARRRRSRLRSAHLVRTVIHAGGKRS